MSRPARRNFRFPLLVRRLQDDIDQELAFHVETAAEELAAEGWDPAQARAEALRRFGDVERYRRDLFRIDRTRDSRQRFLGWAGEVAQDVAFALRQLRRRPGFTVTALLLLTLGIGASTAIFTALYQLTVRPLPLPGADRVVHLGSLEYGERRSVSTGNATEWQRQARSFSHLTVINQSDWTLRRDGGPERVGGAAVTPEYFAVFGVAPLLGRTFTAQEATAGNDRVVVLSHQLWQSRFGADPRIVGRPILVDEVAHVVIGVMPASLDLDREAPDLWKPLPLSAEERADFGWNHLTVYARLRPGVSLAQAQAEMDALAARLALAHPEANKDKGAYAAGWAAEMMGRPRARGLVIQAAVLLVLLIACANLANLQLARGVSRQREIVLRNALGAGRARILRQLVTESSVLALLGALGGCGLAALLLRAFVASGVDVPRLAELHLDLSTLLASLGLAVLCTLAFGLLPAVRTSRVDLRGALQEGSAGAGRTAARDPLQRFLIAAEVTLAVVLLAGAGLLIRSSLNLQRISLGFEPRGALSARLSLPESAYPGAAAGAAFERVAQEVGRIPGVEAAGLASFLPLSRANMSSTLTVEGRGSEPEIEANVRFVTPGYFQAIGLRLERGRALAATDRAGGAPVVVVNRELARRLWPGKDPLGRRLTPFGEPFSTVVGVVGDLRSGAITAPAQPEVYIAVAQAPADLWGWIHRTLYVVARAPGGLRSDPAALARSLERAVAAVDPRIPVSSVETVEKRLAGELATHRAGLLLFVVLGGVALLLALMGIYGVISHYVAQRAPEIALRLALGASPRAVLALMVRQALRPVGYGLAAGTALSLGFSRGLRHLLYGVNPGDPLTLLGVVVILGAAAAVAGYDPARRAIHASTAQALREV